uniref:Uncharacterized protein n=1 Tax=Chenopodium quinoa TaxID=63459 RepID=A0A803KVG6_CHEQI
MRGKETKVEEDDEDNSKEELNGDQVMIEIMREMLELKDKEEKIDILEKKLAEAEMKKEFLERLDEYYFPRVQNMQLSVPSSKISISFNDEYKDGRTFKDVFCAYIPIARIESESLMPKKYLKCGKTFYSNFGLNNWKVLQVEDCLYDDPEIRKTVMYYYAGGSDSFKKKFFEDMETVPIPCHPDHLKYYHYWDVRYILGIGTRLTI